MTGQTPCCSSVTVPGSSWRQYTTLRQSQAPLAESIAEGLRLHDIPATSAEVLNLGNLLEGWYFLADSRAGRVDVVVYWRLSDREGRELLAQESRARVLLERLAREPALGGVEFAEHIVPAVARTMIGDRSKVRRDQDLVLILGKISGAPGDGDLLYEGRFMPYFAAPKWRSHRKLTPQARDSTHKSRLRRIRTSRTKCDSCGRFGFRAKNSCCIETGERSPKGRIDRKWGSLAFDIALAIGRKSLKPFVVCAIRCHTALLYLQRSAEVWAARFRGDVYRKKWPCYRNLRRRQAAAGRRFK